MIFFVGFFVIAFCGMMFIVLRHLPEVRKSPSEGEPEPDAQNSIARVYVVKGTNYVEHWYQYRAKEEFLKLLDRALKLFERSAGKIAGQTKHMRLLIQERFRVIPRESMYWKQIHSWKKGKGTSKRSHIRFLDLVEEARADISNHPW